MMDPKELAKNINDALASTAKAQQDELAALRLKVEQQAATIAELAEANRKLRERLDDWRSVAREAIRERRSFLSQLQDQNLALHIYADLGKLPEIARVMQKNDNTDFIRICRHVDWMTNRDNIRAERAKSK